MNGFRTDINGLRAWAVVAVVLFHFGVPGFDGGFIGVDVFFVISGFLMTGIILGKLLTPNRESSFSLLGFYLARARRIIPALMALCIALLILGWYFLPTYDYRMLATHVITALLFISNIKFWREAGYFDPASHEKLLLHTWSLSVEWQFYLLFPIVLMVLWKLWPNRRFIGVLLLAGFVISLGLSIAITRVNPGAAFYLLPTRAWEMLAGSLVYFYANQLRPAQGIARTLEIFGFTLILASILLFDGNTPWPGWQAMMPVLGTVMVLLASRSNSFLTGTIIAQWLGKASYSIYLWHWPLSVGLIYLELHGDWFATLMSLMLTLLLGWVSWRFVEQSIQRGLMSFRSSQQIILTGLLVLLIAIPALAVRINDGVEGRFKQEIEAIFAEAQNANPRRSECIGSVSTPTPGCTYGGDSLGVIVIGDSHAQSVIRSVENALPSKELHVLDWTISSCPTIFGIKHTGRDDGSCEDFFKKVYAESLQLDREIPMLIVNRISSYFEGPNEPDRAHEVPTPKRYISNPYQYRSESFYREMQQGIIDTACAFSEHRDVFMLRPIPELKLNVPRVMGRAALLGRETRVWISLEEYEQRHLVAWKAQDRAAEECGITMLDPRPYLCGDDRCWGDINGIPVYTDDDHLSERGGQLLTPLFRKMFE